MTVLNVWRHLLVGFVFAGVALAGDSETLPTFNPRDCKELKKRQTYYQSLIKSGETYCSAGGSALKKDFVDLAATNVIDGYRYAYASRLVWEVEWHQKWIPFVTNHFFLMTRFQTIESLQSTFASKEANRAKLLADLERLAQDPRIAPKVKTALAEMAKIVGDAKTPEEKLPVLDSIAPGVRPVRAPAPPDTPTTTPKEQLNTVLKNGDYRRAVEIAIGDPRCSGPIEQALQTGPDPLTSEQARRAAAILARGAAATKEELEELFQLNKLHPNNSLLHEIKIQMLMAKGLSRDDAEAYLRNWLANNVGGCVIIQTKYPTVPLPKPSGPYPAAQPTPTSTITTPSGDVLTSEEKIKLFDKDGKPVLTGYKVKYLAEPGQEIGKIQWEEERLRSYQPGVKPDSFVMSEVPGKRIEWAMQIKEARRDNLRVTYELVDLERPSAEFTIDEWVMTPASGQPQRGTGTQFEITFPGPGTYTVEVHGKTGWGNAFVVKETIKL